MKKLGFGDGRRKLAWLLIIAVAAAAGAVWVWAQSLSQTASARPLTMAAMLPQGPLLSIESPDFHALLHDWESSPEESAWIKSDNYGVFARSRLFGRLQDAQKDFAAAAGVAPDEKFLDEIAGTNSIFAWYDIGKLEFLYITRMPAGKAEQTRLMQSRSNFSQRQVGGSTFYVRTRGDDPKTVAFALSGDYLLLATREDLMASALALIAGTSSDSLATEPWFVDIGKSASASPQEPALRMALNLDRIVKTPYFRSYWVQQNVTEMKQYRAALSDLYREPTQMREERVLLPKVADDPGASQSDLGDLVAIVPPHASVYRALFTGDVDVAMTALDEKLLRRGVSPTRDSKIAPETDLDEENVGSANDLETRIDTATPLAVNTEGRLSLLRKQAIQAGIAAVLTVDSTQRGDSDPDGTSTSMWVPLHSAVVIRAQKPWDQSALETGFVEAMKSELSAGDLGLKWTRQAEGYVSLGKLRPFQFAVVGNLLFVTDDAGMMRTMLARARDGSRAPVPAKLVAEFDHDAAAPPFAKLSALLDKTSVVAHATGPAVTPSDGSGPAFFSGNLRGLSDAFAGIKSERIIERVDGGVTRQTLTYVWQR